MRAGLKTIGTQNGVARVRPVASLTYQNDAESIGLGAGPRGP